MTIQRLQKLKLFKKEKLLSLDKLDYQGYCNINYKLKTSTNTYLIRVFKSNDTVNISREFEYRTQKKAYKKGISSKPLFLNKKRTFMITEFLEGIHKEKLNKKDLKTLIKNIKKLHKIKSSQKAYNFKKDFKNYKKILKDKKSRKLIKKSLNELDKISIYKKRYVTTHHDLNPKNIIFYKNRIKFIDWEYVGVNDCYFDLATICVEFNLNKKERNFIVKKYYKTVKKEHKICLEIYINIYKALCKLWFKTLK